MSRGGGKGVDDAQAGDIFKILFVSRYQRKIMHKGGGGDDRVRKTHLAFLAQRIARSATASSKFKILNRAKAVSSQVLSISDRRKNPSVSIRVTLDAARSVQSRIASRFGFSPLAP